MDGIQEIMQFDDFMEWMGDGESVVPDGYTFVPMVSLSYPEYTVWCFPKEVIEEMRRYL
jgi:hypothetical protein